MNRALQVGIVLALVSASLVAVSPASAQSCGVASVTIGADDATYAPGDTVTIEGEVTTANCSSDRWDLLLDIRGPDGNLRDSVQLEADTTGAYDYEFVTRSSSEDDPHPHGTYDVSVSASGTDVSNPTTFELSQVEVVTHSPTQDQVEWNQATLPAEVAFLGEHDQVHAKIEWGTSQNELTLQTSELLFETPDTFTQTITGLEPETTYYFQATAQEDDASGEILSFTTPPRPVIEATTGSAASIGHDQATLQGEVVDFGVHDSVDWRFQYGTTQDNLDASTSMQTLSSSSSQTKVSIDLSGLADDTTYYYRFHAQSPDGGESDQGAPRSFTTTSEPVAVVKTVSITGIQETNATLRGTVDNLGTHGSVDAYFQWGTAEDTLDQTTSKASLSSPGSFSVNLDGLDGATTYYVQAVTDQDGATGAVLSFTTLDFTPPSAPGPIESDTFPASTWTSASTGTFSWAPASDTGSGVAGYTIAVDGTPSEDVANTQADNSTTQTGLADGQHTLSVRAIDQAGNAGDVATYDFWVDASAPTAPTLESDTFDPAPACNTGTSGTFTWSTVTDATTGLDPDAPYAVRLDDEAFQETTDTSYTVDNLADGAHSLDVRVQDELENTATQTFDFHVDTVAPTVSLTAPSPTNGLFTLQVEASDTCASVASLELEQRFPGEDAWSSLDAEPGSMIQIDPATDGEYAFRAKATDTLGNAGSFPTTPQLTVLVNSSLPETTQDETSEPHNNATNGSNTTNESGPDEAPAPGLLAALTALLVGAYFARRTP